MREFLIAAAALVAFSGVALAGHSGSYTGRLGNTTSWNSSVSHGTATGSITGPAGGTTSGTATEHYEGHGNYGVTGTVTGPQGGSYSGSGTVTPK